LKSFKNNKVKFNSVSQR